MKHRRTEAQTSDTYQPHEGISHGCYLDAYCNKQWLASGRTLCVALCAPHHSEISASSALLHFTREQKLHFQLAHTSHPPSSTKTDGDVNFRSSSVPINLVSEAQQIRAWSGFDRFHKLQDVDRDANFTTSGHEHTFCSDKFDLNRTVEFSSPK